jgi:hypothetical protein
MSPGRMYPAEVATDRDRFARVLDKRFRAVAYAIDTAAPDSIARCGAYLELREREADPDLRPAFHDAHRVLVRAQPTLPEFGDPDRARIVRRGMASEPATRLALAYEDVRNGVCAELAEAYARRQVRWMRGNIEAYGEWDYLRAPFAASERRLIEEMTRRNRRRFLGLGEATPALPRRAQVDILHELIPLR